jgi:hypothetical protein
MSTWLLRHADALVATALVYIAIGIWLGPALFCVAAMVHGTALIVLAALGR